MSTETTAPNGTAAAMPSDPLAHIIEELEGALAPLTARRAQLEAELSELQAQELRVKDALAALGNKARGRPKAAAPPKNSHDWTPAQKTIDDVYAVFVRAARDGKQSLNLSNAADGAKTSRGTAKKAIDELRAQNKLRFVGQGGTGGANLYALMPSE